MTVTGDRFCRRRWSRCTLNVSGCNVYDNFSPNTTDASVPRTRVANQTQAIVVVARRHELVSASRAPVVSGVPEHQRRRFAPRPLTLAPLRHLELARPIAVARCSPSASASVFVGFLPWCRFCGACHRPHPIVAEVPVRTLHAHV